MSSERESAIDILEKLVSFNTINNPEESQYPDTSILSYVKKIVLEWNSNYQVKFFTEGSYSSVYIAFEPEKSCDILFMGHLDVVPIAKGWSSDPFTLTIKDKNIACGRGSKDCKGSVVSALLFLKEINEDLELKHLVKRIGMLFSLDEESGGQYGTKLFFQHASQRDILPKYVINVDGGPKVVHKRRAGFQVRLTAPPLIKRMQATVESRTFDTQILHDDTRHSAYFIRGCDTHALISLSKYVHINPHLKVQTITGDWIKNNVIPDSINVYFVNPLGKKESNELISYDENLTQLVRILKSIILSEVKIEIFSEFGVTINPNFLLYTPIKGTKIQFDVRAFLSPSRKDSLIESFNKRLEILPIDIQLDCKGSSGYFYTDPLHPLVTQACKVMRSEKYKFMGENELPREQEGASDARYASQFNVPVIDLGPKGGNVHGSNEYIHIDSMIQFASLYRDIVILLISEL